MEMKDSGVRRSFFTGAVRDGDATKPRPDLISPFALMRLGEWMRLGAAKYADRNWEQGMPFSIFYESLFRHLIKYGMGLKDEDHLAAICFNAMAIMHFEELNRVQLDDMPKYPKQLELFEPEDVVQEPVEAKEEEAYLEQKVYNPPPSLAQKLAASFSELINKKG